MCTQSPYKGGYVAPASDSDGDVVDLTGATPEPNQPQDAKGAVDSACAGCMAQLLCMLRHARKRLKCA